MAVTSEKAAGRAVHVKADSESSDDPYDTAETFNRPVLTGRSHGELGRFTATQCR